MDAAVKEIVASCSRGSDENSLTFPDVLGQLGAAGVEGYYADLRRGTKTYYLPDGESIEVPGERFSVPIAPAFDAVAVAAAVRAIQLGSLTYREFCEGIMRAGCAGYLVSLLGRRALYFGRTAETYTELFPTAP